MCPESCAEIIKMPSLASSKLTIRTTVKASGSGIRQHGYLSCNIFTLIFFKWVNSDSTSALAVPC